MIILIFLVLIWGTMAKNKHSTKVNQEWQTFIDPNTGRVVILKIRKGGKCNQEQSGKRISGARNTKYIPADICQFSERVTRNVV
jgi:hypothetical protein